MKKLILFLLFCSKISATAQCPSNDHFFSLIKQIKDSSKLEPQKKLNQYVLIENEYAKCSMIHDTVWSKLNNCKGIAHYGLNHLSEAIYFTEKALIFASKYRKIKPKIYSSLLDNLGFYHYVNNDFEKSNEYYLKEIEATDINSQKAYCYKTIATTTFLFGDFESSIKTAKKGLLFAKNDNYNLADLYNIISNSYYGLMQYDESYQNIKLALNYFEQWQNETKKVDYLTQGIYILNMGNNLKELKKYNEAQKYFVWATNLFTKVERYDKVVQNGLVNQGDLFEITYRNNEAKTIYAQAEKLIKEKLPDAKDGTYARVNGNLAKILANEKNFELAIKNYEKAFEFFPNFNIEIQNFTPKTFQFLKDKAILQDILTDYADCLKSYYLYSNHKKYLNESIRILQMTDKVIDAMRFEHIGNQSKLFWRTNTRHLYESAIETCYLLKDYEKAFYFFEKSRSVLLNDKLNELGAKQKLSEEDLQKEKDFQKQIADLNASIEKAQNAKLKGNLNNKLIDLQEQQDRFVKTLETKNPAYYQIKYDTTNYNLKQIQAYLGVSGGSLVEYFVGDSTTYAIVISPNTVSLKKLNFNVNNTQQFANLCSKKITTKTELSTFLSIGSEVYKSLILPLNLLKGHLIISQDGVFLPFEALSKSVNKPDYLLNDFMISYTYSAQFLLRNKPRNYFLPNHKFIGIAPVNFTQKLNPLNDSDKSIDNIAKSYFWSNQLIGQEGSKKAFLSNAKNYQIVQIYTHAFADSNETEPRIYFADSALKVSDLSMEDQFKTNLLVLSACKTGVGKVAKGEGVLSLARGFSMAGIPSTITSLWSIEDRDTYSLTELFYKYFKEGFPKDEALQKAKIEFISLSENAMPNAWAGMVLIGDNSPLEKRNSLICWILGGLLLGGIGFYFKQKSPQKQAFPKF